MTLELGFIDHYFEINYELVLECAIHFFLLKEGVSQWVTMELIN